MRFLQYPFLVLGLVVKNIELSLHAKPKFDSFVLSYKNMMADKIPSNFCTGSCYHYSLRKPFKNYLADFVRYGGEVYPPFRLRVFGQDDCLLRGGEGYPPIPLRKIS